FPDGRLPIGLVFQSGNLGQWLRHRYITSGQNRGGHDTIHGTPGKDVAHAPFIAGKGHTDHKAELTRYRIKFPSPAAFIDRSNMGRGSMGTNGDVHAIASEFRVCPALRIWSAA